MKIPKDLVFWMFVHIMILISSISKNFFSLGVKGLKVFGDGTYILWMVDDATRLIRGEVIYNKEPDTIIAAMNRMWINGYGIGPGIPEKYFHTDNGGEFFNAKLLNLCQEAGIKLKKTASFSPQQNGLNERNHGVTDLMIEKIRRDEPKLTMQEAVYKATWARNSLINAQRGFSPFQLVFGRSPTLQGASDCTTGGLEDLTGGEISRNILWQQNQIRLDMLKADHDWRIKTAMKDNLPKTTNIRFNIGDQVVFKDHKDGRNHDARIVGFDGPNALLRWGNMDRRVPERELLPSYEVHQEIEEENEGLEDQEIGLKTASEKEDESDTEVIQERRPTRRGPKRKKKEINNEIPEKRVVREDKVRHKGDEKEEKTLEPWSEDEEDLHKTPSTCMTRPPLHSHIDMWNNYGEKFSGFVAQHHGRHRNSFRIQELGTNADIWVDLRRLNYWEYQNTKTPKVLHLISDGVPSPQALLAASQDYELYE
jgi:hypothetical protein